MNTLMALSAAQLQSDIDKLLGSLGEYDELPCLESTTACILSYLGNIYGTSADIRKYIYPEIIRQMVAMSAVAPPAYREAYEATERIDQAEQVRRLLAIPQAKQRSAEWYKQRQCTLGASETAVLFGFGGFGSEKGLLRKKLGLSADEYRPSAATQHGVKYEPIIQQVYQAEEGISVLHEFGSLIHPTVGYISASPDGITATGRMVEIKAPYARDITGIPPGYYWTQMQQQMEVCNLEVVDFIECQLVEATADLWLHQARTPGELHRNRRNRYRGVFRETTIGNYEYPELDSIRTQEDYDAWTSKPGTYYHWTMEVYSKFVVHRNRSWWNANVGKLAEFWNKLEEYRKKPAEVLAVELAEVRRAKAAPLPAIKAELGFDFVDE